MAKKTQYTDDEIIEKIAAATIRENLRRAEELRLQLLHIQAERNYRTGLHMLIQKYGNEPGDIPKPEIRRLTRFSLCRILTETNRCLVCTQALVGERSVRSIAPYCLDRLQKHVPIDIHNCTDDELYAAVANLVTIDNRVFLEEITDDYVSWDAVVTIAKRAGVSGRKLTEMAGGNGRRRNDPVSPLYQVYYSPDSRQRYFHIDAWKHFRDMAVSMESNPLHKFSELASEYLVHSGGNDNGDDGSNENTMRINSDDDDEYDDDGENN